MGPGPSLQCGVCGFEREPKGCANFDCPASATAAGDGPATFERALSDALERAFGPGTISKIELGAVQVLPAPDLKRRAEVESMIAKRLRVERLSVSLCWPLSGAFCGALYGERYWFALVAGVLQAAALVYSYGQRATVRRYWAHWRGCAECRAKLGDPDVSPPPST